MQKYSEKFINNSSILKKSVVGYELEFYMKDLSYYKTLEILNQYLAPIRVHGFREYHPDFKPDKDNFCLTPDLSGGANLCELITGPLPYFDSKYYLIKILKFIQEYGYTTEKCSIHYNISFNHDFDKDLNDLNILKLILNVDEDEIYRFFPGRKGNVYAKTVKKIIPYKEYDFNNIPIDVVRNNLRFPSDKYFGINFLHINKSREEQRLEFRYIGGKDYEKNIGDISYFLDKFIIDVNNSINATFNNNDIQNLENYLDMNISNFKNFSKYDNFIINFPKINIQIDQNNGYDVVNAYYQKIYPKLFNIIDSTDSIENCIINYVTTTQRMEIIDCNVKSTFNIKDYDFINCRISDGIYEDCFFANSEINNSQLIKSKLYGTTIKNSKLLNCAADASFIIDCFWMNGYLNGDMQRGVFRSGKLGPYANVSSDTKIVTDTNNFFDTLFEDDDYTKSKDKGIMSVFKK